MGKIRTLNQIMKSERKARAKKLVKEITEGLKSNTSVLKGVVKEWKKYLKRLKQHGKTKRSKK